MIIRVNFVPENEGVWAVVENQPGLKAFGATRDEAMRSVLRLIEAHYKAKAVEVQSVVEVAAAGELFPGNPLPNEKLRALAKKHRPPESWFEETQSVL